MKNLLTVCSVTYSILFIGKKFNPDFLGAWFIQTPLLIFLSVLLPIGFVKSLIIAIESRDYSYKSLSNPIGFLLLFCLLLMLPLMVHHAMNASYQMMKSLETSDAITSRLIEGPIQAETEEIRLKMAQMLYREYGKKVPYKKDNGSFIIFEPTGEDMAKFKERNDIKNEGKLLGESTLKLSKESMIFSILELICFFVFVSGTLMYEKRKR